MMFKGVIQVYFLSYVGGKDGGGWAVEQRQTEIALQLLSHVKFGTV